MPWIVFLVLCPLLRASIEAETRRCDSITCKCSRFLMNMLIRIVCVHFTIHFFESLLHSREVSSTNFCIVEKTLYLLYPFSGVHLGTRPLESRRQV